MQAAGGRRVLDPSGAVLTTAQGKGHTKMHDEILTALQGALEWVGVEVQLEVRGVFVAAAQQHRISLDGPAWQWARPDMRVRFPGGGWEYFELKTCTLADSHYPATRARRDEHGVAARDWGAEGRARKEQRAYDGDGRHGLGGGKARAQDVELGWMGPGAGPFQRKWREIGGIKVLAVGAFAEVSRSLHELLARAADVGAVRLWRRHGCRSEKEAKSLVSTKLTARLGTAFVRAQAKLFKDRLHLAEPGGAQRARDRAARDDYTAHLADLYDHRMLTDWYNRSQHWRGE